MKKTLLVLGIFMIAAVSGALYGLNTAGAADKESMNMDVEEAYMANTSWRDIFDPGKFIKKIQLRDEVAAFRAAVEEDPFVYDKYETSEYYYPILGPEIMLDVIEENPYCHAKGHNLGRLIYINSGRNLAEALKLVGNRCTWAPFHGVLTQIFKDLGGDAEKLEDDHVTAEQFKKVALDFCDNPDVKEYAGLQKKWTCVHAVGHAFGYLVDNDIPKALELCGIYPEAGERYYCAQGVYMQREKTAGDKDAKISKQYPCDQGYGYSAACYRYKLRKVYGPHDALEARDMCATLSDERERSGCYHGLGFTYFDGVYKDPDWLKTLCSAESEYDSRLCTEGAIGMIGLNVSDLKTIAVCTALEGNYRGWCNAVLRAGIPNVDFKDYDEPPRTKPDA